MKYSEFTDDMRQEMIDAIKSKLLKLGINADVNMFATTNRLNEEYIHVETTRFNTTPVVYKSIHIDGYGCIEHIDKNGIGLYELRLSLHYRFKYFNGGENGVEIGNIVFRFFENSERVVCSGLTI